MPSGFQQSVNQLSPGFYRVVINTGSYPTIDGNTNGGITPNSADSFTTLPSTLATGKQRARGNMRFRNIVNRLAQLADCSIIDIEITEATADTQATSIQFTVRYDRPQGLLGTVQNRLGAPYTGFDGVTVVNTDILALTDQISRGISDASSANVRVYDGDSRQDTQQLITLAAPLSAAAVWASVSVTLIDGTEIISVI